MYDIRFIHMAANDDAIWQVACMMTNQL